MHEHEVLLADFGLLGVNGPDGRRRAVTFEECKLLEWAINHQEEVRRLRDAAESKKLGAAVARVEALQASGELPEGGSYTVTESGKVVMGAPARLNGYAVIDSRETGRMRGDSPICALLVDRGERRGNRQRWVSCLWAAPDDEWWSGSYFDDQGEAFADFEKRA